MENNTLEYSISEVSQLTGIKDFTLRVWEKRYKLMPPARTKNNKRVYREADVEMLRRFAALIKRGYKISEIVSMSAEEISIKIGTVFVPKTSNQIIKRLMKLSETFDTAEFDKELKHDILDQGLEHAIINIIVPMMETMEAKYIQDPDYLPVKQFAYDIIRRRIIVASDVDEMEDSEGYVIFSPLDDNGELSLLIVDYILKKYGRQPVYCGHKVRIPQVKAAIEKSGCRKVVLVGRLYETTESIADFVDDIRKISGIDVIVLDRNYCDVQMKKASANNTQTTIINDIQALTEYLKK
ncbi:MAG: MerR family transcriptional regulator [Bacteroidales bacterium]|nr:MerR family transcriptional regulator [Bacteroidales bacterium]